MVAESYIEILRNHLLGTVGDLGKEASAILFQQDNDLKHTARASRKWFRHNNISTLDWPPQTPDLNPIEHLWGTLKKLVVGEISSS